MHSIFLSYDQNIAEIGFEFFLNCFKPFETTKQHVLTLFEIQSNLLQSWVPLLCLKAIQNKHGSKTLLYIWLYTSVFIKFYGRWTHQIIEPFLRFNFIWTHTYTCSIIRSVTSLIAVKSKLRATRQPWQNRNEHTSL